MKLDNTAATDFYVLVTRKVAIEFTQSNITDARAAAGHSHKSAILRVTFDRTLVRNHMHTKTAAKDALKPITSKSTSKFTLTKNCMLVNTAERLCATMTKV